MRTAVTLVCTLAGATAIIIIVIIIVIIGIIVIIVAVVIADAVECPLLLGFGCGLRVAFCFAAVLAMHTSAANARVRSNR